MKRDSARFRKQGVTDTNLFSSDLRVSEGTMLRAETDCVNDLVQAHATLTERETA
jgi:hypothetical protein